MVASTILQSSIFTDFAFPFLLVFFILFGVLEKLKVFGDDKHMLNAMISFVVGLIFVAAVFPKAIVGNLILFLTVAIVVVFIALLLWGFIAGEIPKIPKGLQAGVAIVVMIAVVIALLWAMGIATNTFDFLFNSSWSSSFWTNFAFIVVVIIGMAVAIGGSKGGSH